MLVKMSMQLKVSAKSFIFLMGLCLLQMARGDKLYNEDETLWNKPSIKIIETEHGDVYDCVDFYKQPTFDHPLLKKHTFHPKMRPSYSTNALKFDCYKRDYLKLKDGGCPVGFVPILRVSKNEAYKINNFTQNSAKSNAQPLPGTHLSILETTSDTSTVKYTGLGGSFSLFNISLEQSQYSSGVLIVQNGEDRIKVGWTVNPSLYKNNITRLFQQLDAGQSHCYNTLCPGFISTNKDIPISLGLRPNSVRGVGKTYFLTLHIHQDATNGHWWLSLCHDVIGFWPKQIFTTLSNSATYMAVGGEAYGPTNLPLPPMGNGYFPVPSVKLSAFAGDIVLVDENHKRIDHPQLQEYVDDPHYGLIDVGDSKFFGRFMFYGGPNK